MPYQKLLIKSVWNFMVHST